MTEQPIRVELMSEIVRLSEGMLAELTDPSAEKYRKYVQMIVEQARYVQNEFRTFLSSDGNKDILRSTIHFTRAPLAIINTKLYILKMYHERLEQGVTEDQLATLEEIRRHLEAFTADLE